MINDRYYSASHPILAFRMRHDHGLALQTTLEIEPANKRQPLEFRSDLMVDPSLTEFF
jgi:hypothetical protein